MMIKKYSNDHGQRKCLTIRKADVLSMLHFPASNRTMLSMFS